MIKGVTSNCESSASLRLVLDASTLSACVAIFPLLDAECSPCPYNSQCGPRDTDTERDVYRPPTTEIRPDSGPALHHWEVETLYLLREL